MRTTPLGLTALAAGEPLSTDGYSFQSRNPDTIDALLGLGALRHRHDEHAALAHPTVALTGSVATTGGSFPAATSALFEYTLVDAFGGETLPSDVLEVVTPAKIAAPNPPVGVPDYTAGTMLAGTYLYVLTWTDGAGGETLPSQALTVTLEPGHANAQVDFSGLNTGMPAGATGWRLYKSARGSNFLFVAEGAGATLVDNGSLCADCTGRAPSQNTTLDRNVVHVTLPATFPAGTVAFRLYGSLDGAFSSPAFLGQFAVAGAGTTLSFSSWSPSEGSPPVVATALAGAEKIDPETEINGLRWRTAVANAAALPAVGNTNGDVRLTLDDHTAHVWNSTTPAWQALFTDRAGVGAPNVQTADYTLALGDANGVVEVNSAGAHVVTLPDDAAVNFPIGTIVEIARWGAGTVTLAAGGTAAIESRGGLLAVSAQYGVVRARKRAANDWHLAGDLA